MTCVLILFCCYLFIEHYLFRGQLVKLFIRGWREYFYKAATRITGKREAGRPLTCRDCPDRLPASGTLNPDALIHRVSYGESLTQPSTQPAEIKIPDHSMREWKAPRAKDEVPQSYELIVGTFDPETEEEIDHRKIELTPPSHTDQQVAELLDSVLFEREFTPPQPTSEEMLLISETDLKAITE